MQDTFAISNRVIAYLLWAVVKIIATAAWVSWFAGNQSVAYMLGFTACASSAVAAVVHIRFYMLRVCGLIRSVSGGDGPGEQYPRASVYPMR